MPKKQDVRLIVRKLRFGDRTSDGQFYAVVGGKVVNVDDRCFWPTKRAALTSGIRFLTPALEGQAE